MHSSITLHPSCSYSGSRQCLAGSVAEKTRQFLLACVGRLQRRGKNVLSNYTVRMHILLQRMCTIRVNILRHPLCNKSAVLVDLFPNIWEELRHRTSTTTQLLHDCMTQRDSEWVVHAHQSCPAHSASINGLKPPVSAGTNLPLRYMCSVRTSLKNYVITRRMVIIHCRRVCLHGHHH